MYELRISCFTKNIAETRVFDSYSAAQAGLAAVAHLQSVILPSYTQSSISDDKVSFFSIDGKKIFGASIVPRSLHAAD